MPINAINILKNDRYGNELIKKCEIEDFNNYSKLIVNPGEKAIFIKDGVIVETLENGKYDLLTGNIPIIKSIKKFISGGVSPNSCMVYFVDVTQRHGIIYGTGGDVKHPKFGPVHISINGRYGIKISDVMLFFTKLVGNRNSMYLEDVDETITRKVEEQIRDAVISKIGYAVLKANTKEEISTVCSNLVYSNDILHEAAKIIKVQLLSFGIELVSLEKGTIAINGDMLDELLLEAGRNEVLDEVQKGKEDRINKYAKSMYADMLINSTNNLSNNPTGVANGFSPAFGMPNNNNMTTAGATVELTRDFRDAFVNNKDAGENNKESKEETDDLFDITPANDKKSERKQCPNCGASVPSSAKFCTNCRAKLGVVCPNCGAMCEPNTNFCGRCGADL